MKYKISLVLLILASALALTLSANSIFSFYGFPIQNYGNDVYGSGMGDTGSGDLFRINTNYLNPSIATTSTKVTFSTAVSMGYIKYKDQNNSYTDDGLYFPYFTITVPTGNHKFAFSFNSFASGNLENEVSKLWEDYDSSEINRINSSIYKLDLIYAFKNKYLNTGFSVNYYIGHRTRYWKLDFDDSDLIDPKYELEKNFKNPGFTVGVSKKIGNFSMGLSYNTKVDMKGDVIYKYGHPPYADTLITNADYGFDLPARYSAGLTWRWKDYLKSSVDVYYDLWEDTEEYDKNTLKVAVGFAYDPLSGYGKWYERIPVRFGAYLRELPFEVNSTKIMENAITFGTSVPLKSSNKKIDLAVSYIVRGKLSEHDLQDNSLFFSFGITGFDIFSKRMKRTEHRDIPQPD